MAKQTINQGTAPTGVGGDTFRTGSAKLQANDDEIYNYLGDGVNLNKLGTAAFKDAGTGAGNVMEVGAFGVGASMLQIPMPSDSQFLGSGFYYFDFGGSSSTWQQVEPHVFVMRASFNGVPRGFEIGCLPYTNNFYLRGNTSGGLEWRTPVLIRHSGNTSVDSNGFLKSASPIVKLFADKIELNHEALQQDIAFEKFGIGDYLIKGSSGFAQEGWYIETPKDANGNVLFSVIYETLENGDISVKTYKKKFDLETASIVADLNSPVDIPVGRWIDIRLQELPRPEIEMPESATPPEFQPTGLAQAVATVMESYHDPEQ